jgi:hypothetical protein
MFEYIKNKMKAGDLTVVMYLVFGVLTTLVDWVAYRVLRLSGLGYMFSNVAAWGAAVVFAFVTNKFMVFNSKSVDRLIIIKEFISFVGARVFSLLLQLAGIELMINYANINEYIAKAVMTVVVVVCNYVFSKLFIFKDK